MTITLRPEDEQLVRKHLETGAFADPSEVVHAALEEWEVTRKAIEAKIERGIAQLDRGEGIPGDVSRQRVDKRKRAWLAERQRT